ncbi:D-tagatose-bisphosphate aldolase, class II, non-catalytic subunit [uncultured Microbulbifer sp.]|uniref:D-tagatose-bisphosphate aldolase, class II, non-catalytic subunit n=1 Tax=uncultured Microbulbifer sp. TaxID=348147 RepID=UPI002625A7D4|nr:D-tagatose-bisphosphate aldolase, class II, non-catalytic subunit [uncultured Microbulbifer sp.]
MQKILDIASDNRRGLARGIYAICTAHPLVLKAALLQGLKDNTPVLIEATANQVNQFGGYTGMQPADFIPFVNAIAETVGFDRQQIIFGGDHLGPVCWVSESAEQAMAKAKDLIRAYVAAGFKKIHLDTSMRCADDTGPLTDATVAERAAALCAVAEKTALAVFGCAELVYVVGTEVPPPGGAAEAIDDLQVTGCEDVLATVEAHRKAFFQRDLSQAWERVVGLVVQPGVEFDHTSVHDYRPDDAKDLAALLSKIPNLVFEAHSTDYQPAIAYTHLIADHFAILKVGPQLTYALREALFSLSHIEDELITKEKCSGLRQVCEDIMLASPEHWANYYPKQEPQGRLYRRYSYSDRIRYYWVKPEIEQAVTCLMNNLTESSIPEPLLAQYLPQEYQAVRSKVLKPTAQALVLFHIMQVIDVYAKACWKQEV